MFSCFQFLTRGVTPFASDRNPEKISEEIDRFNTINREESEKRQVNYVDITTFSREVKSDHSFAGDLLHPSGKAYEKWAALAATFTGFKRRIPKWKLNGLKKPVNWIRTIRLLSPGNGLFTVQKTWFISMGISSAASKTADRLQQEIQEPGTRLIRSWNEGWYTQSATTGGKLRNWSVRNPMKLWWPIPLHKNLFKLALAAVLPDPNEKSSFLITSTSLPTVISGDYLSTRTRLLASAIQS